MSDRVYKILTDWTNWQALYFDEDSKDQRVQGKFTPDGRSKAGWWKAPKVFVLEPLKPRPDFARLYTPAAFAVQKDVYDAHHLCDYLDDPVGEALPLDAEDGSEWLWINVVNCLNVLDRESSDLTVGRQRLTFRPNRFTEFSVFKVPELANAAIFCWETDDQDTEVKSFKALVESQKLTGLAFEKVWTSDS